jgi:LysM repeat protein
MYRRQLAFLVLVNAIVSLVIALAVVWVFELRRPDPEELAALEGQPLTILAETPPPVSGGEPNVETPSPTPTSEALSPEEEPVATPTTGDTPAEPEGVEGQPYEVQQGDSLLAIATRFGVTVDDLMRANNLSNPDFLFSGQQLIIPVDGPLSEIDNGGNGDAPTSQPSATPTPQGVEVASVSGAGDLATELVLVVNESNLAVSLQGWQLEREGGPAYLFGNVPLFPGGSIRVHSSSGVDSTIDLYWGQSGALWQSGAVVRLRNAQGETVYTFTVP